MNILKTKPKYRIEIGNGAFIADFYVDEKHPDVEHNYLHIHTPNKVFEQKVVGYPYGYLLAAVSQGNEEEVHGYCMMLWRVTQEIYQDAGFANDIIRAINKRDKRLTKQAEKEAAQVSEAEEMASQAFMEDVAAYADASPKERKRMSKESRKEMKQILNEESNGE
jgi:hypothetical protein